MGVMECSRIGCENTMCRRHSDRHGYICEDCFEELLQKGPTADVAAFMKSYPSDYNKRNVAYKIFDEIFPYDDDR